MCGIVGYIGRGNATTPVLDGLKILEYRGYDSAGVCVRKDGELEVIKSVGKVINLDNKAKDVLGDAAIGHTRWATHGGVTEANSHPHYSTNKEVMLVHNGVIHNYAELKEEYLEGVNFYSQTDTEVLANLVDLFKRELGTMEAALVKLNEVVDGSYALAIMHKDNSDVMYAIRKKSPLLLAKGDGYNMIASDTLACIKHTNEFIEFEDGDFARIDANEIKMFDANGNKKEYEIKVIDSEAIDFEKGSYDTFMLKEIDEQAINIRKNIKFYQENEIDSKVLDLFKNAPTVHIIAAGTSWHAGLVGKDLFKKILAQKVEVHVASEFAYDLPLLDPKDVVMFISQSGETADLRACYEPIREAGLPVITLTNVPNSTLDRESDYALYLNAGTEVAVASTKAYTANIVVLAILINAIKDFDVFTKLSQVAQVVEQILDNKEQFEVIAKDVLVGHDHAFYLGRGVDQLIGLEAALKLKEISYIHTESYSAGELKHGTISLITDGTPVIGLISDKKLEGATRSNLEEVAARGGNVVVITKESMAKEGEYVIGDVDPLLTSITMAIPCQLISYYTTKLLGNDVDKPRNLAKSVTVE